MPDSAPYLTDVIQGLVEGRLTIDDAYNLFDQWLKTTGGDWHAIGFSDVEYTAFAQGAGLEDLAQWRASCPPSACAVCGQPLPKLDEFGWFVWDLEARTSGNETGSIGLVHIDCLDSNSDESSP